MMPMTPALMDDVRVLDLSQGIAGPFAAKIMADFGADVIKVEPPGGEKGRMMGPFFKDDPHPEKSLFFLLLNLNKRGVTLNLETKTGQEIFKELVRQSDVVVESYQPGYLASLGLDYESLEKINPRIIMTSITTFGQYGPYSHYKGEEILAYAMSGIMSISGTSDREPLKHGGFQGQYEAGINGALSSSFALLIRDFSNEGQHVDVSIQEVVNSTMVSNQPFYSWTGAVQGRRRPLGTMYGNVMPCKDGFFISQGGGGATWDEIANFYGEEILKEPRFANNDQRALNGEEFDKIIVEAVKERTMKEMFKTASEQYRMLFGIVQTPKDLAECPQLESRDFYQMVDHPVMGKVRVPFRLFNMSETPAQYRMPSPLLGQHNEEVYTKLLRYTKEDLVRLRELNAL
ncbi:MAG: CoA transferase [Chloroflexi bacterium]|nr:CoA transferase [Chloroflexota bacterium]